MATKTLPTARDLWALVQAQHGVVARSQLLAMGLTSAAIQHRLATGRLHRIQRGVYAVGRPDVTRRGTWMAAILACGFGAVISYETAALLWGISNSGTAWIEITVPGHRFVRRPGVRAHRRTSLDPEDLTVRDGIPVTTPLATLLDLGTRLRPERLERAINEADRLDLVDAEEIRARLDDHRGRHGVRAVRKVVDRDGFVITDTQLEQRFLPIARRIGLPPPLTQEWVNGFRVDFFWPELGLVVETDGLRYHRTPAQQAADRVRDQAHTAAGMTPLRFTRRQVCFEVEHVEVTLEQVVARLTDRRGSSAF